MVRRLGALLGLLVMGCAASAQSRGGSAALVADALSWYAVWRSPFLDVAKLQFCTGEVRGRSYHLGCNPLGVDVEVDISGAGVCSIRFMQPHFDMGGKRGYAPPRSVDADFSCGGLPPAGKPFAIPVKIPKRTTDEALSRQARDLAFAYFERTGALDSVLHFPKVSAGDPFFDVYQERGGVLEAVWEFPIDQGRPLDFAQWTYTRHGDNLPLGAERRLRNPKLWIDIWDPGKNR